MADHDSSYRLFFSHPEMVRDLLTGFVDEKWVEDVEFSTLERVNASFVSDRLKKREDDVIWRVKLRGEERDEWLYLYLLFEFQSTPDRWMALRIMVYVGLLYQELIRRGEFAEKGKLPAVFPLVLYNGEQPWRYSEAMADLIQKAPGELVNYQPSMRYLLLEERHYRDQPLPEQPNIAAALMQLENSQAPEEIQQVLRLLIQWLHHSEQASLRRAFTVWIKRVLLPAKFPDISIPEINDLEEVNTMLAERVEQWVEQWKKEGLEQGMEQGIILGEHRWAVAAITRQLNQKFGPLDQTTLNRIDSASSEQLLRCSQRLLSADTLQAVFDD